MKQSGGRMTLNPMLNYVNEAINFIEDNIDKPVDAKLIADHIAISVSYLKKIFKSITEQSIMEYARARKLNHCLSLLNTTEKSVVDIAMSNGYDYEQSFSRAFKKEFGISPKHYRETKMIIDLTPKLDLSFIYDLKDAMIVKPVFKRIPSFKIGGILNRITIAEKYKYKPSMIANDFYYRQKHKISNPVNEDVYYGYTMPDHDLEKSTFYLSGLEVSDDTVMPEDFHVEEIPEKDYIIFKFIGNFDASKITWEHLLEIWQFRDKYLESVYNITDRIYGYFEYIDGSKVSHDYCELELYVPIEHK